jgi:hypothetical protein
MNELMHSARKPRHSSAMIDWLATAAGRAGAAPLAESDQRQRRRRVHRVLSGVWVHRNAAANDEQDSRRRGDQGRVMLRPSPDEPDDSQDDQQTAKYERDLRHV